MERISKKKTGSIELKKQVYQAVLILSLLFLFLTDIATLLIFPYLIRFSLEFLGFLFDIYLTFHFFSKIIQSYRYKRLSQFLKGDFWLEIFSSLIPLLFYSFPLMLISFDYKNSLENSTHPLVFLFYFSQVKYLRLLRFSLLLSSFLPFITYNNRTLIIVERVFLLSFFLPYTIFILINAYFERTYSENLFFELYLKDINIPVPTQIATYTIEEKWPFILAIKDLTENQFIYLKDSYWQSFYGFLDYTTLQKGFVIFYIDKTIFVKERAKNGIFLFFLTLSVFMAIIQINKILMKSFIEPIEIILKGIVDPLELRRVQIPSLLRDDLIFKLAKEYNNKIIPNKMKESPKTRIPFSAKELRKILPEVMGVDKKDNE